MVIVVSIFEKESQLLLPPIQNCLRKRHGRKTKMAETSGTLEKVR